MNEAVVVAGFVDLGSVKAGHAPDRPGSAIPATSLRVIRTLSVLFFSAVALLQIGLMLPFVGAAGRAKWLHRWCRFACRVLGLRLTTKGSIPNSGLLVCNHLSYLDIIALSSLQPCVFVAKRDVRDWPLFGWLARAAGTLFVERNHHSSVMIGVAQIRGAIESGLLVVLFPEGTSSDGATVLPFKSSLLQAVVESRCRTATGGIDYHLPGGSVADEVCYWRDMTLVPHLLNLFGKPRVEATIRFSSPKVRFCDRKTLARELRAEVAALRRLLKCWDGPRVEAEGVDGKERTRRIPSVGCNEGATPPAAPSASRPQGCAEFGAGRRCSLGRDRVDSGTALAPWPAPNSTATRTIPVFQQSPRQ